MPRSDPSLFQSPGPKPVIAISQRRMLLSGRSEEYDALDRAWWRLAGHIGFTIVPVPSALQEHSVEEALLEWLERLGVSGVLLTGGGDVGDDPARDQTEQSLISWAHSTRSPLLAVCRGMQHLGEVFGASMVPCQGHIGTTHALSDGRIVNSFHGFALERIPDEFELVASCANDGVVEDIRHVNLPWRAVMWHPEREQDLGESSKDVFSVLLGESN